MKKILLAFIAILLVHNLVYSQSYVVQGDTNPCASVTTSYNLVAVGNPPSTSGCTIGWTVTNGTFIGGGTSITSGGTGVQVIWNNNPASPVGRISAILSGNSCNANISTTFALDVTAKTLGAFSGISVNGTNYSCNTTIGIPCGTTPIIFSVAAPTNATNYQWIIPSGWTISSNNNTSITVIPSQSQPSIGSVRVRAVRVDCSGLETNCVINFTRPTPVVNTPPITNYTICANSSRQITVSGSNATNYSWSTTNGFSVSNVSVSGNSSTATITAPSAGADVTGTVSITPSSVACGNGNAVLINVTSIGSTPSAGLLSASGAGMTVTQSGLSLAAIYNGSLISSSDNSQLIEQVEWQSNSSSVYVSASAITATAFPSAGCVGGVATLLLRVKNCTGNWSGWKFFTVNVCSSGFRFAYSPNPTSDKLDITAVPTEDNKDFKVATSIDFEVKLIDGNGKTVREAKNLNKETKLTLDVKDLKEGVYFLHIAHGKEIEKHQILIGKPAH